MNTLILVSGTCNASNYWCKRQQTLLFLTTDSAQKYVHVIGDMAGQYCRCLWLCDRPMKLQAVESRFHLTRRWWSVPSQTDTRRVGAPIRCHLHRTYIRHRALGPCPFGPRWSVPVILIDRRRPGPAHSVSGAWLATIVAYDSCNENMVLDDPDQMWIARDGSMERVHCRPKWKSSSTAAEDRGWSDVVGTNRHLSRAAVCALIAGTLVYIDVVRKTECITIRIVGKSIEKVCTRHTTKTFKISQ